MKKRTRRTLFVFALSFATATFVLFAPRPWDKKKEAPPAPPAPSAKTSTPAPPPAPAEPHTPTVTATLKAVSLTDAKPLAGMVPIITLEPNAFDAPLAHGDPTGADGVSVFVFPADRKVCLRVWDPTLAYFPNNFFDVEPGTEDEATEGTIAMAKSCSLHALLLRSDGTPAADETVRLMMFHPKRGPWWPSEAKTNGDGAVSFERVPPGMFIVQMECPAGRMRMENITLLPGESGNLGPVTLTVQ
jgi:hypothetical protein